MPPRKKKLFILDTNVLMHDPNAIHRFGRHDIYLPMIVLEELDAHKKGMAETARNVRQVSRIIDALLKGRTGKEITQGIPLGETINADGDAKKPGNLHLQTESVDVALPESLVTGKADNSILASALHLKTAEDRPVVLVSKDINLRIKAAAIGLHAEDYIHDAHEIDDLDLLYSGALALNDEDFVSFTDAVESDTAKAVEVAENAAYKNDIYANQCVWHEATGESAPSRQEYILQLDENSVDGALVPNKLTNYRREGNAVWGVAARNRAQNFAMNMLMDPNIDIVTLCGAAGTGKTLLALAAGLSQTFDPRPGQQQPFTEIIMTRVTVPLGEDIGFLPGTEEEKMTPWMGALMDNLEVLGASDQGGGSSGSWQSGASKDFLMNKIKIRSLNFMRGRTFFNRYVIIDEAQNLTPKQMKALITRVGPNSKIVCMGNLAQIDTPYLTERTSGLTYVVERFKNWSHAGHVTLVQGERSRLADYASQNL